MIKIILNMSDLRKKALHSLLQNLYDNCHLFFYQKKPTLTIIIFKNI